MTTTRGQSCTVWRQSGAFYTGW